MELLRMFKKHLLVLLMLLMVVLCSTPVFAATTADVTVTATPSYIAITDNTASYDFGTVATSSTTNSTVSEILITNASTVQTDMTVSVTGNWTGGANWTHDDTATAGADTAGMYAYSSNQSAWVIVKVYSPNYIYENCVAHVNFTYGISLLAPTSFSDGVQKSNTVRITAAAG